MTECRLFHPAILQLLRLQGRGRARRMWRTFCLPRRMFLSAIACLLALAWLGNAAMTVYLRESASPATLRVLLSAGLALYAGWHVIKVALFRPEGPLDSMPAERDVLASCPLRPGDLVAYQLAAVALPTLLKGGLFAVLLLPDLSHLPLAFAGILLGMYFLETLRLVVELVAWGMSRSAYMAFRSLVVGSLVVMGAGATWWVWRAGGMAWRVDPASGMLQRFVEMLNMLVNSPGGYATAPFRPFVELVVAKTLTLGMTAWAAAAVTATVASSATVVWLYSTLLARCMERERLAYPELVRRADEKQTRAPRGLESLRVVWRLQGAGPLAWRQLLAARLQWGSLATAMVAPAVLAITPSFVVDDPEIAYLASSGALAFYTFLLLPTAVRLDFRRDLNRLLTLKALPIAPLQVAIGQLLAPVILATAFQGVVLTVAAAICHMPLHWTFVTLLVFLPMNVFVFGLDNLIYLLYPYRIKQEGMIIFLRTILTFTGKGMLFALGLGLMSVWGIAAANLARAVAAAGFSLNAHAVFVTGMFAGMAMLAALIVLSLYQAFHRIDPVEDIPR